MTKEQFINKLESAQTPWDIVEAVCTKIVTANDDDDPGMVEATTTSKRAAQFILDGGVSGFAGIMSVISLICNFEPGMLMTLLKASQLQRGRVEAQDGRAALKSRLQELALRADNGLVH